MPDKDEKKSEEDANKEDAPKLPSEREIVLALYEILRTADFEVSMCGCGVGECMCK